jgi:hypothetical protein
MSQVPVSRFFMSHSHLLIIPTGYPQKALAALCQMVVNPSYYITNHEEATHQIHLLENARNDALRLIEQLASHDNPSLQKMKAQKCFSLAWKRKTLSKSLRSYELGYDEQLAPQIAMWAIKSYQLDLSSSLPTPSSSTQAMPTVNKPGSSMPSLPDEPDFIFDGDYENPGAYLQLGDSLARWREIRSG